MCAGLAWEGFQGVVISAHEDSEWYQVGKCCWLLKTDPAAHRRDTLTHATLWAHSHTDYTHTHTHTSYSHTYIHMYPQHKHIRTCSCIHTQHAYTVTCIHIAQTYSYMHSQSMHTNSYACAQNMHTHSYMQSHASMHTTHTHMPTLARITHLALWGALSP